MRKIRLTFQALLWHDLNHNGRPSDKGGSPHSGRRGKPYERVEARHAGAMQRMARARNMPGMIRSASWPEGKTGSRNKSMRRKRRLGILLRDGWRIKQMPIQNPRKKFRSVEARFQRWLKRNPNKQVTLWAEDRFTYFIKHMAESGHYTEGSFEWLKAALDFHYHGPPAIKG